MRRRFWAVGLVVVVGLCQTVAGAGKGDAGKAKSADVERIFVGGTRRKPGEATIWTCFATGSAPG